MIPLTRIESDADYDQVVRTITQKDHGTAAFESYETKVDATRGIVESVREFGDTAIADFTERFDKTVLTPEQFELTADEIDAAFAKVDPALLESLRRAHENILRFHGTHLRESWEEVLEDGSRIGQRITPIESVGVYVPGGTAFYPSSVLMNIVPARVAGVRDIVMVSPPSYMGSIHPVVLAAARLAGVTRVFRIGGAQAVAALAYGTETIPQVLKITGPGNTFVTVAKSLIRHICDIDSEAGPSEVTVVADSGANPRYVAAELLAQAEHDVEASSVLVTDSLELAEKTIAALDEEVETLSRAEIIRESLKSYGAIYVARSADEAAALANLIAPEHLAVYTRNPRKTFDAIPNAGAAMLGDASTVVLGDYFAGPNHILPTSRRARFASPLSAEDFRKVTSIIEYTPERVKHVGPDIVRIARAEELTAHARAIEIRQ